MKSVDSAALVEQAKAEGVSPAVVVRRLLRQSLAMGKKTEDEGGRIWRMIPEPTRVILVMMAGNSANDPADDARRPWGSLSEADRVSIASFARQLREDLREVGNLF